MPATANASFQLQSILCLKQLSGCWDAHTAPMAAVQDHRLGPAFVGVGLDPEVVTHTLFWGPAQAQTPPFTFPSPWPLPAFPAIHDHGGQDLTVLSEPIAEFPSVCWRC